MPTKNDSESQELLNLIGDDAFTRLCMVFGGTRLHISASERSRQRLNVMVGEELAEKIIFHYQGEALSLPKLSSHEIEKRKQAIINDHKNDMSKRDIAMKYDVTERTVRKITSDHSKTNE